MSATGDRIDHNRNFRLIIARFAVPGHSARHKPSAKSLHFPGIALADLLGAVHHVLSKDALNWLGRLVRFFQKDFALRDIKKACGHARILGESPHQCHVTKETHGGHPINHEDLRGVCSTVCATRSIVLSSKCLPNTCRPIGRPDWALPQGTLSPGTPARSAVTV